MTQGAKWSSVLQVSVMQLWGHGVIATCRSKDKNGAATLTVLSMPVACFKYTLNGPKTRDRKVERGKSMEVLGGG